MKWLDELAARRAFGMKPGTEPMLRLCGRLRDPQRTFRAVHIAGTNGKGAVAATLDAAFRAGGFKRVFRYTSPHLVDISERFFLDGSPVDGQMLARAAEEVFKAIGQDETTFFEALTAVAFLLCSQVRPERAIFECGLGGRLDATNVCESELSVITRIGLDHCSWLGSTLEAIAGEKAGIVKRGVPIVLGRNAGEVVDVVRRAAKEKDAPFYYAPDIADESEIPHGFSLGGSFNRENAVTAIAALKTLGAFSPDAAKGFANVTWPGRFQRVGDVIVDGAHNPPAARALADSLAGTGPYALVAGFCADKDVASVLKILAPVADRGFAVRIDNPRSMEASAAAKLMREAGIDAVPCNSLDEAISRARDTGREVLVCGSLFLAGEALLSLGAYPWPVRSKCVNESLSPRL